MPEERPVAVDGPFPDGALFVEKPGVRLGFPHVHGPAHDQQKIIRGKRGDLFAPVQHHNVQFGPALAQEIAEQSGRLVIHMLEHKGSADHVSVLMSG